MDTSQTAVADTGLLVAAMRAQESRRDDPLFSDPFADAVAGDLADDWPSEFQAPGFEVTAPTVRLIESLLQYLARDTVNLLFERVDSLSATGSRVFYDVVGTGLLESLLLPATVDFMKTLGAPSIFGWTTALTDIAEPATEWQRRPVPVIPPTVPGAPRGYFVSAVKQEPITARAEPAYEPPTLRHH